MQSILINTILLLFSAVLFTGCQQKPVMPDEIARNYWSAVKSGDTSTLKSLTINHQDVTEDQLIGSLQLTGFKIRRTIIEDDNAVVEVDLQLADTGSIPVPVNTVLIKQDQSWLVDHRTTVASLRSKSDIGDAIAAFHKFSRLFSKDLDQSLTELERQAPAIRNDIVNMMEKFTERVPALKKQLEQLIEDIDKTVKPLIEKENNHPNKADPTSRLTPQSDAKNL
jgi:hypothetical protein